MNVEPLCKLSTASLRALAASLREGALSSGITSHAVQQIAGPNAAEVERCLKDLLQGGISLSHIAVTADVAAHAKAGMPDPATLFDLVLSGPELPGIPTSDTAAVMQALIEDASAEILLVGYAVHNGQRLFERLAARMQALPALRVTFCLDISRPFSDTSLTSEIVRRFAHEFRTKHWPWPALPNLYYDPRSLSEEMTERSSLHAKCIVVDRRAALVTSANFTEAAHVRNIEAGVLMRHAPLARRLAEYFEGLMTAGQLVRCHLA